jgi:S-DNA-T family DNA segregation ATPase FtsK/SpoIIIE
MTPPRHIRRQARKLHRSGIQPIVVIGDSQGLEITGLILFRLIWRYRSELAPGFLAAGLALAAWRLHGTRPHPWPLVLATAAVAACMLPVFGTRLGIASWMERAYAAVVAIAAGLWIAAATAIGPGTAPLPQVLILGGSVLAVPWWGHRRRRAKVRVERKLDAWPDIAQAVGLPGSQVMSAVVDLWGWRARVRLARGQTITDVIGRIAALESALGTFRGAVRVYPTGDDLANRCELRVLEIDPHADAIPWPGPSVSSITEPIEIGPFEDASPCRVLLLRRNGLVGGVTGSGKSGGLNVLLGNLSACRDVVIWGIDLKRGIELGPWADCIDRLAVTPDQACALLADAVAILEARAAEMAAKGRRTWEPSPEQPALVIIIDEFAELADDAPAAMAAADSVARLGRAVAVNMIAATQRPTQKAMGHGAVRSQMDIRISFRVRERKDVELIMGQGMLAAGWHAQALDAPGKFLISAPEHRTPRRARAYLLTDETVTDTATRHADLRPALDAVSLRAIEDRAQASRPTITDRPQIGRQDSSDETGAAARPSPDDVPRQDESSAENALWLALCLAPDTGTDLAELMRVTGMSRPTVYRHLHEHAVAGRVVQVSRGRWRAQTTEEPPHA